MSRRRSWFALLLFALLLLPALRCTSAVDADVEGSRSMRWQMNLESSGGITGRGAGNVSVASDGTSTAGAPSVSAEVVQRLNRSLDEAWSASWQSPAPPERGADMFEYTLRVTRDGETREVSWREDVEQNLPPAIRALVADLRAIRTR